MRRRAAACGGASSVWLPVCTAIALISQPLCTSQSGFPYRNPERLKAALEGSVLCLRAEAAQPQVAGPPSRLIGFARACSDATLVAVIWDVVVR